MSDTYTTIDINTIDLSDDRFSITEDTEPDPSVYSNIQEYGNLLPPLLWFKPDSGGRHSYIVINGLRRIAAFRRNHVKRVDAIVVPPGVSEKKCLIRAISIPAFQRPLSLVEVLRAVWRLASFFTDQQISQKACEIMNQALNIRYVKQLNSLKPHQAVLLPMIQKNKITLKTAFELVSLGSEHIGIFTRIFSAIKASASVQKEIIRHLTEVSSRETVDIKDIFAAIGLDQVLADSHIDIKNKTQKVRQVLFDNRFPTLSQAKKKTQHIISQLPHKNLIQMTPPHNFEARGYQITFSIESRQDFINKLDLLKQCANHADIQKLFWYED